jgi:nitrate reductase NapE component
VAATGRTQCLRGEEMQDVIYIVLTVVLFGVLALAIRGAERL